MKNVTILRVAVACCVLNGLLAIWLSWSVANARNRIATGEEAARQAGELLGQLRTDLDREVHSRQAEDTSYQQGVDAAIAALRDEMQGETQSRKSEAASLLEMLKALSPPANAIPAAPSPK